MTGGTGYSRASLEAERQVRLVGRRTRAIRANTRDRIRLITEGLEAGDWRTLGYDSPAAWYTALTDYMLAPPEVRKRLAAAMRAEGYSLRGIATGLDVSKDTVARDLAGIEMSHGETPATVTGMDGKAYPASRPPSPDQAVSGPGTGSQRASPPDTGPHPAHCRTCTCFAADGEP